MRFAYADPPYMGQGHRYPEKTEVDHVALVARLWDEFPDGWALSASSPSLWRLLQITGSDVRVMAWVKPFAVFKPNVGVAYAWEPIIVHGGRRRGRDVPTVRDWVSANITLKKGLVGAKPEPFAHWLMDVLNVQAGDEFVDLYPGTGIISRVFAERTAAWTTLSPNQQRQGVLNEGRDARYGGSGEGRQHSRPRRGSHQRRGSRP